MNVDVTCSDLSEQAWDAFVGAHPQANIFQTMALFRVYQETRRYMPICVFSLDPISNDIRGVMTGVIIREMDGLLGDFSARSIIQGGPILSSGSGIDVVTDLLRKYDSIASKSSLYTEIRNLFTTDGIINTGNYHFKDHLNFLIHIDQTEDEVWGQIHKARRKNINRAERAGVVLEELDNREKIPKFYDLLEETYRTVKVPLADISLFESAFRNLVSKGMAKFFFARREDDYIGARAVLLYNKSIYDWYAGASINALQYYPNDFLVWHILKWGVRNNYSIFDFGGAGDPNKPYGPREFKRRFGGELVNFGRYTHEYSRRKIRIAATGFKVYRKLFL